MAITSKPLFIFSILLGHGIADDSIRIEPPLNEKTPWLLDAQTGGYSNFDKYDSILKNMYVDGKNTGQDLSKQYLHPDSATKSVKLSVDKNAIFFPNHQNGQKILRADLVMHFKKGDPTLFYATFCKEDQSGSTVDTQVMFDEKHLTDLRITPDNKIQAVHIIGGKYNVLWTSEEKIKQAECLTGGFIIDMVNRCAKIYLANNEVDHRTLISEENLKGGQQCWKKQDDELSTLEMHIGALNYFEKEIPTTVEKYSYSFKNVGAIKTKPLKKHNQ